MFEVVLFSVIILAGIILFNSGAVLMNLQRYKKSTVNDTISEIDIDNNTKIITTETDDKTSLGTIPDQRQDSIQSGIDNAEITSEKTVDELRYDSDSSRFRKTDGIGYLRSPNSHVIKRFSSFSKELPTTVPQQPNANAKYHQQRINVSNKCENNVERHQSDKSNKIIYLEIIRDMEHTFEVNLNNANITLLRSAIRSMKTLKKDQQHYELLGEIKRMLTDTVNLQSDTKVPNINNEKKYFIIDEYRRLKDFFNYKVNKQYHFDITLKNTNAVLDIVLVDKKPIKTDNVSQNHDAEQINNIDRSEIQKSKIVYADTKNKTQKITDQNDDKNIIKKHIEDTLVNYHINKIEIIAANYDIVNNNVFIPVFTTSSTQKLNHIFNRQKKEHNKNITGYNVDKKLDKNFIFTSVYAVMKISNYVIAGDDKNVKRSADKIDDIKVQMQKIKRYKFIIEECNNTKVFNLVNHEYKNSAKTNTDDITKLKSNLDTLSLDDDNKEQNSNTNDTENKLRHDNIEKTQDDTDQLSSNFLNVKAYTKKNYHMRYENKKLYISDALHDYEMDNTVQYIVNSNHEYFEKVHKTYNDTTNEHNKDLSKDEITNKSFELHFKTIIVLSINNNYEIRMYHYNLNRKYNVLIELYQIKTCKNIYIDISQNTFETILLEMSQTPNDIDLKNLLGSLYDDKQHPDIPKNETVMVKMNQQNKHSQPEDIWFEDSYIAEQKPMPSDLDDEEILRYTTKQKENWDEWDDLISKPYDLKN